MDAWGSLAMLINRQTTAKNRKADIRKSLKDKKVSFINNRQKNELKFPELSKEEMSILKQKIRTEYKKKRIRIVIVNTIIILLVSLIIYFILLKKLN